MFSVWNVAVRVPERIGLGQETGIDYEDFGALSNRSRVPTNEGG
jgi:hypothetical protein